MTNRVGTWPWLLRHELRLVLRNSPLVAGRGRLVWTLLGLQLVMGIGAAIAVWVLSRHPVPASRVINSPLALIYFLLLVGVLVSSAIKAAVVALFDGGDIELLLSSPVPSRTVFIVRLIRVAVSSGLLVAIFILPVVNVAVCMGHLRLLAAYPVLGALFLTAASVAMLMTLWMVRWLGAKKARLTAQVSAALCGGIIFIALELPTMLKKADAHKVWLWLQHSLTDGGWLGSASLLRYPIRAAWGNPLSLLVVTGVAVVATSGAVWYLGNRFNESVLSAQSELGSRAKTVRTVHFSRSLGLNLLVKEWRLIYRDPFLISRIFRQLLFMVPAVWIFLFKWHHSMPVFYWVLGGVVLFVMATLASELSWLTVCGEDAPVLLGCAPVSATYVNHYKSLAALLPVWLLGLPLAIVLARHNAYLGACFGGTFVLATWTMASLTVWMPWPGNRRDFGKRRRGVGPDLRRTFLGLGLFAGSALTYYFLAKQSAWAGLALAGTFCCAEVARRLGRRLQMQLQ